MVVLVSVVVLGSPEGMCHSPSPMLVSGRLANKQKVYKIVGNSGHQSPEYSN